VQLQLTSVPGATFTYLDRSGRSDSAAVLTGLINAAIQNVEADVPVTVPLTGNNISVVCVTDSLNGNHLEILKDINVDVIDNVTVAGVNVLSSLNVLSVANNGSLVYVAPQGFTVGSP
jgi:phage tail sheath gpL-like